MNNSFQSYTFQDTCERASNVGVEVDVPPSEGEVDVVLRSVWQIQDLVTDNHLLLGSDIYHLIIIFDDSITQCLSILLTHFFSCYWFTLAIVRFAHLT